MKSAGDMKVTLDMNGEGKDIWDKRLNGELEYTLFLYKNSFYKNIMA